MNMDIGGGRDRVTGVCPRRHESERSANFVASGVTAVAIVDAVLKDRALLAGLSRVGLTWRMHPSTPPEPRVRHSMDLYPPTFGDRSESGWSVVRFVPEGMVDARHVDVEVRFGGGSGPDMEEMAQHMIRTHLDPVREAGHMKG